jgi:hypothetical protein
MFFHWTHRMVFAALLLLSCIAAACDSSEDSEKKTEQEIVQHSPSPSPTPEPLPAATAKPIPTQGKILANMMACGPNIKTMSERERRAAQAEWLPLQPQSELEGIVSISTGRVFDAAGYGWRPGISYAIAKDGTAWEWGHVGPNGQDSPYPKQVQGIKPVKELSGSFVLSNHGEVWRRYDDQAPVQVDGLKDIVAIQQLNNGMFGTLYALDTSGQLWGMEQGHEPKRLRDIRHIQQIHGTAFSVFLIDRDGKLFYLSGRPEVPLQAELKRIDIPGKVERMSVAYNGEALILTESGQAYRYAPEDMMVTLMPSAEGAIRLAVSGSGLYMIVKADGTVWGWGDNSNHLLGKDKPLQVVNPVQIEGLRDIVDIQLGTDHALALDSSGGVYSWGSNMTGQLGRIPAIFERWTEFADVSGVKQLEGKYFIRDDGSVWELAADRQSYQIEGPVDIKAMARVYGIPITLSRNGQVSIWPESFSSCEALSLPFVVKDLIAGEEHLLLQTDDDRLFTLKLNPVFEQHGDQYMVKRVTPETLEPAVTDSNWVSKVAEWYSNHYTFLARTTDGKVYYADRKQDAPFTFKPVSGLQGIVDLAPEYFVRYTMEPATVWALDENGTVHEFNIHVAWDQNRSIQVAEVKLGSTVEKGISMISGRLRVTKDGYMYERDWEPLVKERVPQPIQEISSSYGYAIEGPGGHHHLLLTKEGKLAIIGQNPFGEQSSVPGKVLVE